MNTYDPADYVAYFPMDRQLEPHAPPLRGEPQGILQPPSDAAGSTQTGIEADASAMASAPPRAGDVARVEGPEGLRELSIEPDGRHRDDHDCPLQDGVCRHCLGGRGHHLGSPDHGVPQSRQQSGRPNTVTAGHPAGGSPGTAGAYAASAEAEEAHRWIAPRWEEVVREHSARVYRLAYRLSGNVQDAEDLTQETFIRVFRSLADYSPGTFEGWLHRITSNLFLDMARRRQRIRFEALPTDTERLSGTAPGPEQVFADAHLDSRVQAALDALKSEFRVPVILCDIEGLTYGEISVMLGIKLGTVRSRIHRGRIQLREALGDLRSRRSDGAATAREEYRLAS